ncbi:MAG: Stp1/IreP family PP2C-type Ser/Thr phosphatase [Bdellovibrionales bacterium]|nr:Stp1/IreP family PP2C-type Ser/Thr phosphatase [Bdellovibrionales bacterium]
MEGDTHRSGSSHLEPAAITDTGCERDLNEDRYAAVESNSGTTWLVCDGMGGQTGGELAAQLAIDAIRRDLENLPPRPPMAALKSAVIEANRIIVLRRQNQAFAQMGTTATAVQFFGSEVAFANVGDSRVYLIRDGAIQQLTVDHTYVQELVDSGQIRPEEALSHPQAHILTRCIGAEPGLEVDLSQYWIWEVEENEPKDILLLCTDGLYSLVDEGEIASIVSNATPSKACVQLVELAKERGGYDNITLVVIPLSGQLRTEAPSGYSTEEIIRTSTAQMIMESQSFDFVGAIRFVVTLGILSTVALFLSFLAIVMMVRV